MQKALERCSASLLRSSAASALRRTRIAHSPLPFAQHAPRPAGLVSRNFHQITRHRQEAAAAQSVDTLQDGDGLASTFEELGRQELVHPRLVTTLTKGMNIHTMTDVQKATINTALSGTDLIAQARTGTGKTIAFLLPIAQNVLRDDPQLAQPFWRDPAAVKKASGQDIRAIIISPTRELAEQIAVEAKALVRGTSVVVQTAVGGSQKAEGLRRIRQRGCHILVATPGRLEDVLTDTYSGIKAPNLKTLVLDEADRLLETGFSEAIQRITELLPPTEQRDRQTMMFSATVPREVVKLVRKTLKPGFEFVQCIKDDEEPTHERVPQRIVEVKGFENKIPALLELLAREAKAGQQPGGRPLKAIVYFNSTAEVQLYTDALFNATRQGSRIFGDAEVYGLQSRLTQQKRSLETRGFRNCRTGILISSDVSARGMDFPDVTHVIQMSTPVNRDQYIHRIGRTGRAGKEGQGYLILSRPEIPRAEEVLQRLPIVADTSFGTAKLDLTKEADVSPEVGQVLSTMQAAFNQVDGKDQASAYLALLGVHQADFRRNAHELVAQMNRMARYTWGMTEMPRVAPGIAQRMGVKGVEGLNSGYEGGGRRMDDGDRDFGRGSFGSGRREGGFGRGGFGSGPREGGFAGRGGFGSREGGSERGSFGSRGGGSGRGGYGFGGRGDRDGGFRSGRREGGFDRGGSNSSRGGRGMGRSSFGGRERDSE